MQIDDGWRPEIPPDSPNRPIGSLDGFIKHGKFDPQWQQIVTNGDSLLRHTIMSNLVTQQLMRIAYHNIHWDGHFGNRKTAWFTQAPCKCEYKYSTISAKPQPYPVWLTTLQQAVSDMTGSHYNCCNANLYHNGNDYCGLHADDEPLFDNKDGFSIASLSVGATRKFNIQSNVGTHTYAHTVTDGMLLEMGRQFQSLYRHGVMKEASVKEYRINFTFRFITSHHRQCPCI